MSADNVGSDNHVGRDDPMPVLVAQDDVSPNSMPSNKGFLTSSLTAAGAYLLSWLRPRPALPDTPGMRLVKRACSIVGSVAIAFGLYALALTLFQHKLIYMMPRYSHHQQYYTNMLDSIELIVTASTLKKIALSAGVSPSVVPVLKQPLSWNQRRRAAIHLLPHERAVLGDAHRISIPLVPLRVPVPPLTYTNAHAATTTTVTTATSRTTTVVGRSMGNVDERGRKTAPMTSTSPGTQTPSYAQEKRKGKINSKGASLHSRTPSALRLSSPSPDIVSELFLAEVAGAIATGTSLSASTTTTTFTSTSYTTAATGAVPQPVAEASHAVVFYVPSVADAVRMRAGKAPRGLTRRTVRVNDAKAMRGIKATGEEKAKDGMEEVKALSGKRTSREKQVESADINGRSVEKARKAANVRANRRANGHVDAGAEHMGDVDAAAETEATEDNHKENENENVLYVFTGGNAMSALDWLPTLRAYLSSPPLDPHASFLLIDYPGYGLSTGTPSPAAILSVCQRAVRAVLAYCRAVNAAADAVAVSADTAEDTDDTPASTVTNPETPPTQVPPSTLAATPPAALPALTSSTSLDSPSPFTFPAPSASHHTQHHTQLADTCPALPSPLPLPTLAAQHAAMHLASTQSCSAQPPSSPSSTHHPCSASQASSSSSPASSSYGGSGSDTVADNTCNTVSTTYTPTSVTTPTPYSIPGGAHTPTHGVLATRASHTSTPGSTPRGPTQRSRSRLSHTTSTTSTQASADAAAPSPTVGARAGAMRLSVQDAVPASTTYPTGTPLSSPGTPLARSRSVSFSVATVAASVDMPCGMRDGVRVCGEAFLQALAEDPTDTDDILPGNSKILEYRLSGKIDGLGSLQIPDLEESGPSMSEQLFAEYSSPAKNGKQLQKLNSRNLLPFPESPHLFSPPPEVLSSLTAPSRAATSTSHDGDAPVHGVHTVSVSRTSSVTQGVNIVAETATVVSRDAHPTSMRERTTSVTNSVSVPVDAAQETGTAVPLPHQMTNGAVEAVLRPAETSYGSVIEDMAAANAAITDAAFSAHPKRASSTSRSLPTSHISAEREDATEHGSCGPEIKVKEVGPHASAGEEGRKEEADWHAEEAVGEEEHGEEYGVSMSMEDVPHVRLRLVGHSLGCAAALQMGAWVRSRGQYGITPGGRWSGAGVGMRPERLSSQGRGGDVAADVEGSGEWSREGKREGGPGGGRDSIWVDDGLNVPVLPLYRDAKGRARTDRGSARPAALTITATTAATGATGITDADATAGASATKTVGGSDHDGEVVMLHSDGRPLASLSLDRVVLASPFTSLYDMARALVGPIPMLHWLLQHPFNNVEAMQWMGGSEQGDVLSGDNVLGDDYEDGVNANSKTSREHDDNDRNARQCGVFIMHGDRDGIVPVHMGRKLASEARKYSGTHVEYHELHNYGHNDVFEGEGEQWLLAAMRKRLCGNENRTSNEKINQH